MDLYDMLFARLVGGEGVTDTIVSEMVETFFEEKAADLIDSLMDEILEEKTDEISQEEIANLWGD